MMKIMSFVFCLCVLTSSCLIAQNTFPATGDVGIGDDSSILGHSSPHVADFLDPKITVYQDQIKYLKGNMGDYQILTSFGGYVGATDLMWENTYMYRDASGTNWYKSRIHNGIAVDEHLSIPHENDYWKSTLTWWERDPRDDIQAWGNAGTTHMVLNTGKLGIGTTTPDEKLAVNGNIHTKEVRVDLIGWSDFVFEEDYNLPTLDEVEQHIKEKGHLKDIPSAEEVTENGILLGDMNAKLLQKIEELTLYTIQQDKLLKDKGLKIEQLKEELNLQGIRLKKIEKLIKSMKNE